MRKLLRGTVLASLLGVFVFGVLTLLATSPAAAAKPARGGGGAGSGCPRRGIACVAVWDPVICSDGHVYGNSCTAYVACATGCVPYGRDTK